MEDVVSLVQNFLKFTEPTTTLVVHINKLQTNITATDVGTLERMGDPGRILVNPVRLEVRWGSLAISQAFLSNAAHYRNATQHEDAWVIWQDSNMWWFRPCMEQYVRRTRCTRLKQPTKSHPPAKDPSRTAAMAFVTRNFTQPVVFEAHEGSVFSLALLVEMHLGLTQLKGNKWPENWIFATYLAGSRAHSAECTGARLAPRWSRSTSTRWKDSLRTPLPSEFAYKRVPRTAEIEAGYIGVSMEGTKMGHSRKVNSESARFTRQKFLNLSAPPAGFQCT